MVYQTTGVVANGSLQLSERLELPDYTPVLITVRPMAFTAEAASAAWEATKQRLASRPIVGPGRRFTRDELHERN